MTVRFPSTCAGYFGQIVPEQSLNSRFIGIVLNNPELLRENLLFPQRIPRDGYFEEICSVQEYPNEARAEIASRVSKLKDQAMLLDSDRNVSHSVSFLNLVKIILRYSHFSCVQSLEGSWLPQDLRLEFEVQKATANSSERLNKGLPPDLARLKSILDNSLSLYGEIEKPVLLPLTRLIVATYRYDQNSSHKEYLAAAAKVVLDRYSKVEPESLQEAVDLSYAFRGIAMVSELGSEFVQTCMQQAVRMAGAVRAEGELESIAKNENQYTCLQSVTKMKAGDLDGAKQTLKAMIATDPFDPIAYLECGLLMKRNGDYSAAANNFMSAADLGPPGISMNLFFAGQCFAKLGRIDESISKFYESAKYDPSALSPWIEVADALQVTEGRSEELRFALSEIVNVEARFSQLEPDEKAHYQNWLHSL